MKINKISPKAASSLKKYQLTEIKTLLESKPTSEIGFKVTTVIGQINIKDSYKWEIVHRKTNRWQELGFGDNNKFPGYGKLYKREFEVWYCNVGSKERKDIQKYIDTYPLNYDPRNYQKIVGEGIYVEKLINSKGYETLYTALDKKNRKRWYFALNNKRPLWIQTERAK